MFTSNRNSHDYLMVCRDHGIDNHNYPPPSSLQYQQKSMKNFVHNPLPIQQYQQQHQQQQHQTLPLATTIELSNLNHSNSNKLITSKLTYYLLISVLITGIMMLVVVPIGSTFLFIDYKQQLAQRKSNKSDFCKSKCQYGAECIVDEYTNQAYCRCPLSCPDDYQPVCGSDGITYSNKCHLKYESCNKQQNIHITLNNTCDSALCKNVVCQRYQQCQVDENGRTKCVCSARQSSDICTVNDKLNNDKVCGSNGKFFKSLCELEKYSCFYNIDIIPVDDSVCILKQQQQLQQKTLKQSNHFNDSNDETSLLLRTKWFNNDVDSNNNNNNNDDGIFIDNNNNNNGIVCGDQICHYYAECRQQQTIHSNDNNNNSVSLGTLSSLSSSPSSSSSSTGLSIMKTCQCQNNCSNEYDPVCGSNQQNYANECELKSFACLRQIDIHILHRGVCGQCYSECQYYSKCQLNNDNIPECICPQVCLRVDQPVCGDNGVTYENECELRVASCRLQKMIQIQLNSSCDLCHNVICHYGATCVNGECLCVNNCQNNLVEPLCANDGNTYPNECEMNRMACNSRKELIALFYGQCEETNELITLERYSSLIQNENDENNTGQKQIEAIQSNDCYEMNRTCRLNNDDNVDTNNTEYNYVHICDNRVFQSKCDMLQYGCNNNNNNIDQSKHCSNHCLCYKNGINQSFAQLCDEKYGHCICKQGWQGNHCDRCGFNYWNAAKIKNVIDCKPCNCNPIGSINQNCNDTTGKCSCKPGVKGVRCDRCPFNTHLTNDGCVHNSLNNINNNNTLCSNRNYRCRFGAICQSNGSCICNFNCKAHQHHHHHHQHHSNNQKFICASDGSVHESMCHFRQYMCNLQKRLQIIKQCRVHPY